MWFSGSLKYAAAGSSVNDGTVNADGLSYKHHVARRCVLPASVERLAGVVVDDVTLLIWSAVILEKL